MGPRRALKAFEGAPWGPSGFLYGHLYPLKGLLFAVNRLNLFVKVYEGLRGFTRVYEALRGV